MGHEAKTGKADQQLGSGEFSATPPLWPHKVRYSHFIVNRMALPQGFYTPLATSREIPRCATRKRTMFKSILLAAAIVTGFVTFADAARYQSANGVYSSRSTAATRFQDNWSVSY